MRDALGRSIEPAEPEWEARVETLVNKLGEKAYVAIVTKGDDRYIYGYNAYERKQFFREHDRTISSNLRVRRYLLKTERKALKIAEREVRDRKRTEWEKLRNDWKPAHE